MRSCRPSSSDWRRAARAPGVRTRRAVAKTPAKSPEMALDERADSASTSVTMRAANDTDLEACAGIWRVATNDYMRRLNLLEIPDDLGAILRLYRHLLAVD